MSWLVKKIKGLWGKKTLYFLCILAFNYIEFLRATANGDVWKAATNCTGLVMMVIIFSNYSIKNFLNIMNYVYTVLCIIAMIAVRFHWKQHIGEYSFWQVETAIMNIWWMVIMARYICKQVFVTKQMKLRIGLLGWLWIIMVVWSIVGESQMLWPIWFFFVFGFFYITSFSKRDWNLLVNALVNGTIVSFFFIQSYAYLFRPYDIVRYSGAFLNCNSMALYYVIVYVMILVKLHQLHMDQAKIWWKLFYFIGAGGLLAFQFLTICRTAWLTSIAVTIAYGFLALHNHWKESLEKIFVRGCLLVVCATLTFFPVFYSVRYLPTIHPHPIWHEGELYSAERVHSWDSADSEKYIELDEFLEAALGRIFGIFKFIDSKNLFVIKAHAKETIIYVDDTNITGEDRSMSVRLEMWKTYLQNVTWLGHPIEEENFVWKSSGNPIWHSQNVWVQFAYTYGLPVGVLFVIVTILFLFRTYKKGKTCNNAFGIMPFMVCVSFFVFGVSELVWNSGQYILTLFFFVLHLQFFDGVNNE